MPELNVIHIAIIVVAALAGAIVGWIFRGKRSQDEKAAVSAGWQDQIYAQRSEHDRLTDQNKGLMEQIGQYQASNKDAKNRSRELSEAVQEAFARRDELQREIKDIRGNLEVVLSERDQLQSDVKAKASAGEAASEKDARIAKLQSELMNWQDRLPPLIEKFRQRNQDAEQLQADLEVAEQRITELEASPPTDQTRIEPVRDPDALTDGRDASNDPMEDDPTNDDPVEDEAYDVGAIDEDEWTGERKIEATLDEDEDEEPGDSAVPINGTRDNLRAIKGVGPAIEKTLNEMGIFNFEQIADMSEYDIDRIARRLKGFRSRIYREDWIGQARELRDQTSSG